MLPGRSQITPCRLDWIGGQFAARAAHDPRDLAPASPIEWQESAIPPCHFPRSPPLPREGSLPPFGDTRPTDRLPRRCPRYYVGEEQIGHDRRRANSSRPCGLRLYEFADQAHQGPCAWASRAHEHDVNFGAACSNSFGKIEAAFDLNENDANRRAILQELQSG